MYVILNLAIGGMWPGAPDATTPFPGLYQIDYVRAYAPDADAGAGGTGGAGGAGGSTSTGGARGGTGGGATGGTRGALTASGDGCGCRLDADRSVHGVAVPLVLLAVALSVVRRRR